MSSMFGNGEQDLLRLRNDFGTDSISRKEDDCGFHEQNLGWGTCGSSGEISL